MPTVFVFIFDDTVISESKWKFISEILSLINDTLSSYVSIISKNIPKILEMTD